MPHLRISELIDRTKAEDEGQSLVEYGLVIVLVSIFAITALRVLGNDIVAIFNSIIASLATA